MQVHAVKKGPVLVAKISGELDHHSAKDFKKEMQPFFTTIPGDERSGMGFTVMQSFMDGLEVSSAPGEGTVLTMEKLAESQATPICDVEFISEDAVGS